MSPFALLLRGGALSGGGMVLSMLGGMAVWKFITNTPTLSEADVGVFASFIILTDVLLILNNFGLRTALPKLIGAASPEERPRLIRSLLGFQLAVSAGCGALFLAVWGAVREPGALWENPAWTGLFPYFAAVPFMLVAATLREMLLASLAGLHAYGRRVAGLAFLAAVYAGGVGIFVWGAGADLGRLVFVAVLAHSSAALFLYALLPAGKGLAAAWGRRRAALRFSAPLYVNNLFGLVHQRIDTLLVAFFLGPHLAGLFEVGSKKLPQYVAGLQNAALAPYLPTLSERIAANDYAGATHMLRRVHDGFAFLGYCGVLGALLLREPLILLLFSGEYLAGAAALAWIMAAMHLALLAGILGQSLVALEKPHYITWANVWMAAASLGLNLWLLPRMGMLGAGIAALTGAALSLGLQGMWVRRSGLPIPWRALLLPHALFLPCALPAFLGWPWAAQAAGLGLFLAGAQITGLARLGQFLRAGRLLLRG